MNFDYNVEVKFKRLLELHIKITPFSDECKKKVYKIFVFSHFLVLINNLCYNCRYQFYFRVYI